MIALGIGLEEYEYPYPVQFLRLSNDLQPVTMAYMDIPPSGEPNGQTTASSCWPPTPRRCLTT
jgi:hypothetical protein